MFYFLLKTAGSAHVSLSVVPSDLTHLCSVSVAILSKNDDIDDDYDQWRLYYRYDSKFP